MKINYKLLKGLILKSGKSYRQVGMDCNVNGRVLQDVVAGKKGISIDVLNTLCGYFHENIEKFVEYPLLVDTKQRISDIQFERIESILSKYNC